ncbi:hypothetical protein [Kitasatospora sp. NPDC097643]|uniref:hypothetical protein n=1 Tax=Kitasatospora sp. NPDC097643 TaxID=3157230 RepID=UPI00332E217E
MRTRPLAAAVALATAAVLSTAIPAAAHGDTVHLDLAGQQNGHVSTVATWENDHDPVTEGFAGTLSATSADGRAVGPWRLVAVPGKPGTYTTVEILPAGHWKIVVDCAFPSLGHGEGEFDVDAAVINDPTLPVATPTPAPIGPALPTAPTTSTTSAPGTATATTTATAAPTAKASTAAVAAATGAPVAHETTSDAATWAAIGTAVAAVLLVATGFWLRRRSRP